MRAWRKRLPRLLIAALVVAIGAAVFAQVVADNTDDAPSEPPPQIATTRFATGREPSAVLFDGQRLWVAEAGSGTVTSYGLDGQRLDRANVGGRPAALAAGGGFVWALDGADGFLTQIDSKAGAGARIVRVIQVGIDPVDIEYLDGSVWITDPARGTVSQISLDGELRKLIDLGPSPGAITKTPEQVLVADGDASRVSGIDTGGDIVGSFTFRDRIEVGGEVRETGAPVDFLSTRESLWLAFGGIGRLMRTEPSGRETGLVSMPSGPVSLSWSGNELWVASADAGSVTRVSKAGEIVATYFIGGRLSGIAHDGGHAWVVDSEAGELVRLAP